MQVPPGHKILPPWLQLKVGNHTWQVVLGQGLLGPPDGREPAWREESPHPTSDIFCFFPSPEMFKLQLYC